MLIDVRHARKVIPVRRRNCMNIINGETQGVLMRADVSMHDSVTLGQDESVVEAKGQGSEQPSRSKNRSLEK
jgi:hypothetical protein